MPNSSLKAKRPRKSRRFVEVNAVKPLDDFRLRLKLTDGSTVERDLSNFIAKHGVGLRARLKDPKFFRRAKVVMGTVAWSPDVDISPHSLIWQTFPTPQGKRPKKFAVV